MYVESLWLMMKEAMKDLPEKSFISMTLEPESLWFRFEIKTIHEDKYHKVLSEVIFKPSWECIPELQKAVDMMRVKCGLQPKSNMIQDRIKNKV